MSSMKNLLRTLLVVIVCVIGVGTASAAPPVATSFSTTASTVGATLIQLQGSDPDGTALAFVVTSGPSHGTLSGFNSATGHFVYTPAASYVGVDAITFTVTSGAQTSAAATATITVTNAKTRIVDVLVDPAGSPRAGTVTFILTQKVTSPAGIIPVGSTASAVLNGAGQFDISVYPSTALSPQAYYQVWFAALGSLKRELIGVYAIPALATTTTLSPHRVTDTNLAAQYVFVDMAALNSILSVASGVAAIYHGTSTDNVLQRYDSATGKIEDSPITATTASVLVNTIDGMAINAGGLQPSAALQVDSVTRGFLPPRLTTTQRDAMPAVQQGLIIFNSTTNRPNVFTTGWESVAYQSDIPSVPVSSVFGRTGAVVAATNDYSFSQISGSVTDAQVPDTITLTNFNQIGTRSASDLSSGTLPDARFPSTLPAVSGANLTALNGSNISSGTIAPARLGSGGEGGGAKILTDNNTFVTPASLGLVDVISGTAGAIPAFLDSDTIGPSYLKSVTNGIAIDGTASGPHFDIYTTGLSGASNYTLARIYADANVVEVTALGGGTFSGQDTAIRLKALGDGEIQFKRDSALLWSMVGTSLVPGGSGTADLGSEIFPLARIHLTENISFYNSGVQQASIGLAGNSHLIIEGADPGTYSKLEYGAQVYLLSGAGSPEGVVAARRGAIYSRTDGGAGTTLYIKESGNGNTGWVAK